MKTLAVITIIIMVLAFASIVFAIIDSKRQERKVKRFWRQEQ